MPLRSGLLARIAAAVSISISATAAVAADRVFADDFETLILRGTNVVGMEMAYFNFPQESGPVPDTNYPVYDTRVIDYFASKHINTLRVLFSWDGMQPHLYDAVPYPDAGNYQAYFDNYKRIVDYATDVKGMHVVIEPWDANASSGAGGARWRGSLVGSAAVPTAAFADFWSKLATDFKDNPNVMFGLINEPNDMSTMSWWATAQAAVTAIRNTGATQRIFVPGNGYTAASSWTATYYDTATPARSNAYGWLNANGVGQPIGDPLNNIAAEVHTYVDTNEGGLDDSITSITAARAHLTVALNEANAHGYKIYLGEIAIYAGSTNANAAWADFISYFEANTGPFMGFTWFAGGMPAWWHDLHAPHFAITPTNATTFSGDTINMQMIENDFH